MCDSVSHKKQVLGQSTIGVDSDVSPRSTLLVRMTHGSSRLTVTGIESSTGPYRSINKHLITFV